MTEKHLDRLHYYNGKRLVAGDLKLEQEYHIRVRRWLNKSLYSAGIARGLEVREVKDAPMVVVSPGLALDGEGREIILLDEVQLPVRGAASVAPCGGPPGEGSYLVIRYSEGVTHEEGDGCCGPGDQGGGTALAWGGPSRVRAEPVLRWVDVLPVEGGPDVLLAQVSLKAGCNAVQSVDAGVRRYIGAASQNKVKQFALEGVRDVHWHPVAEPAHQRIYFHIRGRQPSSVTLYLRGEKMPSLYYSEMGAHNHTLSVTTQPDGIHRHAIGTHTTTPDGTHEHSVASDFIKMQGGLDIIGALFGWAGAIAGWVAQPTLTHRIVIAAAAEYRRPRPNGGFDRQNFPPLSPNDDGLNPKLFVRPAGNHEHTVGGTNAFTISNDAGSAHSHAVSSSATPAGVTDTSSGSAYTARTGTPLKYVADLEIWIDDIDYTEDIKQQLRERLSAEQAEWARIGNGEADHPLVTKGTREIKLDFLRTFAEGEHWIELRVPKRFVDAAGTRANGGRINYNLYVE